LVGATGGLLLAARRQAGPGPRPEAYDVSREATTRHE
jgi:hypothetical protein